MYIDQATLKKRCDVAMDPTLEPRQRVEKLLPGLGWLKSIRSVRFFLDVFLTKNKEALKRARETKCLKPLDSHEIRRELIRLLSDECHTIEQLGDRDLCIRQLYRESLVDIERRCAGIRLRPDKATEGYNETIAVLHRGIRLARKLK